MRVPLLAPSALCAVAALALTAAGHPSAADELPCTVLDSRMHGTIVIGARLAAEGGPDCALMLEYADWLRRSDTLLVLDPPRKARFTGREWDFALGAVRFGAPRHFVRVRGDSLRLTPDGRASVLHLSAVAAEAEGPLRDLGAWYVLVDVDSLGPRAFRSAVTARRPHPVLSDDGSVVYATTGVRIDPARVRAQLAEARALREALGLPGAMPAARFVVGDPTDTTLTMLGVRRMPRPLLAMMVAPPLAVFAPLSATRGLDAHELVHAATIGRRGAVPPSVGEGFAMHHGGSHGRPFGAAVCASETLRSLPPLGPAELDSAFAGAWWEGARADVSGFALGHAIGWFIAQRGDSAWMFADGPPIAEDDAVGFLAARAGLPRDTALARIAESFAARRAGCPAPALPVPTPPSAAAAAPARASR